MCERERERERERGRETDRQTNRQAMSRKSRFNMFFNSKNYKSFWTTKIKGSRIPDYMYAIVP